MKTIKYLLTLAVFFCLGHASAQEIKVISFNIRFDNPNDAPNNWQNRLPLVESYLKAEMPDIIGVQEALYHQNEDLLKALPAYAYLGTGRDDGEKGGEFSPLFYHTDRFELLDHAQFWLSETPHIAGSIGWEAILPRVVSWAKLRHLDSDGELFVFNTHFSHVSDLARCKSMEFLSVMIKEIAEDSPVIVTGDFNIHMNSGLYVDMANLFKAVNDLQNTFVALADTTNTEHGTFNGFSDQKNTAVIDYIFVDDSFRVKSYSIDKIKANGLFISDHWPVKAVLLIK